MKFLVPNYSCLQNPWLGGYSPQIPVLSVLNWICWTPPPKKIPGYATGCNCNNTRLAPALISVKALKTFAVDLGNSNDAAWRDMTSLLTKKGSAHRVVRERSAGMGGATGFRFLPAAHLSLSYSAQVRCWSHSTSYVMGGGERRRRF